MKEFIPKEILFKNLESAINLLSTLRKSEPFAKSFETSVQAIFEAYSAGGRLYIAGNGGSAGDSQHFSAEFVSKLSRDRRPIAAESLTTNTSLITAIGNDYGYEFIFSRQIEANVSKDDIFFAISTSGNSKNIIEALKACRREGIPSVLLTGKGGGPAVEFADHSLIVPSNNTATIQESHILILHSICEAIETRVVFS